MHGAANPRDHRSARTADSPAVAVERDPKAKAVEQLERGIAPSGSADPLCAVLASRLGRGQGRQASRETAVMACRFLQRGFEPPLDEVLADPIVQVLLQRDGLTIEDVWSVVRQAQQHLRNRQGNVRHLRVVGSVRKQAEPPARDEPTINRRQAVS